MEVENQKSELIRTLEQDRKSWEKLLAEVGAARMDIPGVEGDWSVKDIVGHVSAYELRSVIFVRAAISGDDPGRANIPEGELDERNAVLYERYHNLSVAAVLADAQQVFADLVKGVQEIPAELLQGTERFAWLEGRSLADKILGNSGGHYEEHEPEIRRWLDTQAAPAAD